MNPPLRSPSLLASLIPVVVLVVLLALSVRLFGADSSGGANQIALTIAAAVAAIIAVRHGHRWRDVETAIVHGIGTSTAAILILLSVGALIGAWNLAGTVPAMIYWGLKILHPGVFYVAACLLCALTSLAIGSSWTVAGTLGIGLMGVALGLGLSPAATAGAVISGAYFGDKMSPLSDTTNLAPAVAGVELFTHIRHMAWTTGPSLAIALIAFLLLGFAADPVGTDHDMEVVATTLAENFSLSPVTLLPLLAVLLLAMRRFPALPTILAGAALGIVTALLLQPERVAELSGNSSLGPALALVKGAWIALFDGYSAQTGNALVDDLLSRGGMSSMLSTVWLILSAMCFGAVLEHSGMLERLIASLLAAARSTGTLIASVVVTAIGVNIIAADQYLAIVLPGRMYRAEFERRGLHFKNLSRTVEDAGTITSPLVPWNTCGAYMAATLGIPTLVYLPFCFFNLVNPLVAIIYGFRGFTIEKTDAVTEERSPAGG